MGDLSLASSEMLVVKKGWLLKQGGWVRSWKRRLFALEASGRLAYYCSQEDYLGARPQGHISLTTATLLKSMSSNPYGSGSAVELVTPGRTYLLVSEEAEQDDIRLWVAALALVWAHRITRPQHLKYVPQLALLPPLDLAAPNLLALADTLPPDPLEAPGEGEGEGELAEQAVGEGEGEGQREGGEGEGEGESNKGEAGCPAAGAADFGQRAMRIRTLGAWLAGHTGHTGAVSLDSAPVCNGTAVGRLVEKFTQAEVPGLTAAPASNLQKILNFNCIYEHLRTHGHELPALDTPGIVAGKLNAILQLLEALAQRFEIDACRFQEYRGREAIYHWARYHSRGHDIQITDLSASFQSGLAFCAIAHFCSPDAIDYAHLNRHRPLLNLEKVFNLVLNKWGVQSWLIPSDFVSIPDDFSICLYLTQWLFFVSPD